MPLSALSIQTPSLEGRKAHQARAQHWLHNIRPTRSLSPSIMRCHAHPLVNSVKNVELKRSKTCRVVSPSKRTPAHGNVPWSTRGNFATYATRMVVKDHPRSVRFCPEVQFFRYPVVGLTKVYPQRLSLNDNKASRERLTSPTRASPRALTVSTNGLSTDSLYGLSPTPRFGFRL